MFFPQVLEQVDDLCLDGNIQRSNRLVSYQQFRLHGERSGNGHTLPLAAGHFTGEFFQKRRIHAHIAELVLRFRAQAASGRLDMVDAHGFRDDIRNLHTLIQAGGGILKNDLPFCFQQLMVLTELCLVTDIDPLIQDPAGSGLIHIHDAAGDCGFSGAGLSHQAEDLTFCHLKGNIVHSLDMRVFSHPKDMGQMLNIQKYFRHGRFLLWAA